MVVGLTCSVNRKQWICLTFDLENCFIKFEFLPNFLRGRDLIMFYVFV